AAPEYFSRRRRVLHKTLGYAVRKKRLEKNPLSKGNLPEGWTPPERPDSTLDPRAVGSPALVAEMLAACGRVGRRQGPRFVAFHGCVNSAVRGPPEGGALPRSGCYLPDQGWGYLPSADASPTPGKAYTDDGRPHEHRGLKGRPRGSPSRDSRARKPPRRV